MSGAIPLFPNTPSWRGAQLRHRDNFTFYFKREEDGSWRKLHNDELHNLYSSPNIVRVIKSRRIRWAGHVARMEEVLRDFCWETRK
jgi:hypothetical protein